MPTARLTDTRVRKLRPRESRYEIRDIPGLMLRVEPTGTKVWVSQFKRDGKRVFRKIGDADALSVKEAQALHERNRITFERGEVLGASPVTLTVSRLLDLYWEKAPHKGVKTLAERRRLADKDIVPIIGSRDAATITPGELTQLLEGIAGRGAPVVANRVKEILQACWRWAYVRRKLVPANVAEDLPDMTREVPREVVVKPVELARLWPRLTGQEVEGFRKEMSIEVGTALLLVLFTACRSIEAAGARWGEIDLEESWWTIPPERFKSGFTHRVYLHPAIAHRLAELKPEETTPDTLVFPSPRTGGPLGEKSLHQALTRTNGGAFTVHDIRRSVATAMGDSGVFPYVIERVLGHAQGRLQRTYNRAALDKPAREAWIAWGDMLMDLVRKQGGLGNG